MPYNAIRKQLNDYYFCVLPEIAETIRKNTYNRLDKYAQDNSDDNAYIMKIKQYETIVDEIQPKLFDEIPFFFETGALVAWCDGRYNRGAEHANGWLYHRNKHIFRDADPYAYDIYTKQLEHHLYFQCGIFFDMMHQGLPLKKVFAIGLKGVLKELEEAKATCTTQEETDFITCSIAGINAICLMAQKFASLARKEGNEEIARLAEKVPYNPPETLHEGLCVLAFMRKALGTIEGMGFSSFGRVDVLLASLYENDVKNGVPEAHLLDLVTRFLLIWDCTMNRNDELKYGAEYELENSLTLGGCDETGNPVFNGVTKLFLEARDKETILYPKMMLRFSENSPREYLELIGKPLANSRSFSLYANDSAVIPALVASGMEEKDARDYAVGGCWDVLLPDLYVHNAGEYFSVLNPLLWSIHNYHDKMKDTGIYFESLENAESFDELYNRYLGGIRRIASAKATITSRGGRLWHKVCPMCAMSALMEPCIRQKKDITAGAGKYNGETNYFTLFAETVDSLLAIKKLCFEDKVCTLSELFDECRNNWQNEELRQKALKVTSYGDGSEESSKFVGKFVDDMYSLFEDLPTSYLGKHRIGSHQYTEVVVSRNEIPAMPNGRRMGDFISQGLTPTRTNNKTSLYDIIDSYRYTDLKKFAANASLTLTLPANGMDMKKIAEFFKIISRNGILSIQPNCVSREELLKAQKDPENYGHIIVRVCGFSAPFVLLPEIFQEEILTRTLAEV